MPGVDFRYTYAGWAEAFTIFGKYLPGQADVSTGHEEIFAGPNPEQVNEADRERLEALGWYPAPRYECFRRGV